MKILFTILWWGIGLLFVLCGLAGLMESDTTGMLVILFGIICLPWIRQKVSLITGININGWITFGSLFAVIILIGLTIETQAEKNTKEPVFTILSDEKLHNFKRSVDIRLDRRISSQELENLAHKVKALDGNHYDKIFILYYLPYQELDAGAWASTHFEPELKVEILGVTIDDAVKFRSFSIGNGWQVPEAPTTSPRIWTTRQPVDLNYGGDVIGEWIWDLGGCKITVFKRDGTIMMNSYYPDESQWTKELKTTVLTQGIRLDCLQSNSFGEYFILNRNGELAFYDSDGLFLTLPPEIVQ